MAAQAQSIMDQFDAKKVELGVEGITKDAALAKETPYSLEGSNYDFDQGYIDAAGGWAKIRGGILNTTKYSETIRRD